MLQKVFDLVKPLSKYKYLLLVVLAGLVILLWPRGNDSPPAAVTGTEAFDLRAMEAQLEKLLSGVSGVGNAEVMLTLKTDMEVVVVSDTDYRTQREADQSLTEERRAEAVLTDAGPIIAKRVYPQFRGALVVCDGGGNATVRLAVLEAVAALTGLKSDAVTVVAASSK
ncbi:MAG: hypothetical protein LBR72_07485 [Oscillospiraceae bacterium]|jgi:stage III sporulation protein AG|nr:hypothetical protein [Oscillospiraceae bacterium]